MRWVAVASVLAAALVPGCALDAGSGGDAAGDAARDDGGGADPGGLPEGSDPGPDAAPCGGLMTCDEMYQRYNDDCMSVYPGGDCCRQGPGGWEVSYMAVDCVVDVFPEPDDRDLPDAADAPVDAPDPGPDAEGIVDVAPDAPPDAPADAHDADVPPLPARLDLDPGTLTFFGLPIGSIRYAVSGLDPAARTCATMIWGLYDGSFGGAATCDGSWPGLPYVLLVRDTDGPCGAWDYGSGLTTAAMRGCVDFGKASPSGLEVADFEVDVTLPGGENLTIAASNRETLDPRPVFLGLRYATDVPEDVWIQAGDDFGLPAWAQVLGPDGKQRLLFDRCDVPSCDAPGSGVCGIAFHAVRSLTQGGWGGAAWLSWDGRFREYDPQGDCRPATPAPAGVYTLRTCFGWQVVQDDPGPGPDVKDPLCRETSFTLPGAAKVAVQADFGG